MPAQDGKGPRGTGPVGRGLGPCGKGFPRRFRARGFGFSGANAFRPMEKETLVLNLKNQKSLIEERLKELEN